jgi:1-acyl-sn-glycerol-3-phosphate acyltransferase
VLLATPHTSNWDGLLLVLVLLTRDIGLHVRYMVNNEWIKGPLGPIVRGTGGVGIDRSRHTGVVEQMVEQFRSRDELILAIPPEGTRSRTPHWKSGFYRIALGADVPVICGYLDFARKRAGLGPAMRMTGDIKADMSRIRAFYAEKNPQPFAPAKFGPIRLREELDE